VSCPKERSELEKELELLQMLFSSCDNPWVDEVTTAAMYCKLFLNSLPGRFYCGSAQHKRGGRVCRIWDLLWC